VGALTGRTAPAKIWLCEALFVQNYGPSLLPHSWSLAVEAHFYLLLAVLFAVLVWSAAPGRPPFRCVPSLAAVLAGMVLTARCLHAASGPFTFKESVFPTHLRIDTLFVGVMLSYFHTYHHGPLAWVVRRFRIPLAAAALAMAFPAFVLELGAGPFLPTAGLTALSFAAGSVLLLALFPAAPETWGRSLPARVVSTIGMHSYSVYLWHFPIRLWGLAGIETLTERSLTPPESLVLYVVLSVGGGMALGRLIETPFLALRDRLSAARTMKRHAARAESCPLPDSGAPALPLARMES
jgi:peptidoglycan/LPS O-acetylase OafA/YrhL